MAIFDLLSQDGNGLRIRTTGHEYRFGYRSKRNCAQIPSLHYDVRRVEGAGMLYSGLSPLEVQQDAEDEFEMERDTKVELWCADFRRNRYLFMTPGYNKLEPDFAPGHLQQFEILKGSGGEK